MESLPSDSDGESSVRATSSGNRNRCSVPGTLYNTNTLESFRAIDREKVLKEEARKVTRLMGFFLNCIHVFLLLFLWVVFSFVI